MPKYSIEIELDDEDEEYTEQEIVNILERAGFLGSPVKVESIEKIQ